MARLETQPTRCQDAQQVTVSENRCDAVHLPDFGDDAVGPPGNLIDGFSARARVRENRPTWNTLADLNRRLTLVVTVIPFHEIGRCSHTLRQTGNPAGFEGTLQRAAQHQIKINILKNVLQNSRLLFPFVR
jgi:hypothetical protein